MAIHWCIEVRTYTKKEGISFPVHDVVPETIKFPTVRTSESIEGLLQKSDKPGSNDDQRKVIYCSDYNSVSLEGVEAHPLIAAVHSAFSQHLPLVLFPDILWTAILQGFSQHIRLNGEKYRDLLVNHKGRMQLTIDVSDLYVDSPESAWDMVIEGLAEQLHLHSRNESEALISDFSTTTVHERLASSVVLLDAYQSYFEYCVRCMCGIPEITLTGLPSDWIKLRAKVELLSEFDLEWWLPSVRIVCDQFVRAASGDVDLRFWQGIYKKMEVYGAELLNGWLLKLIPYVKSHSTGTCRHRNPLLTDDTWVEDLDLSDPMVRMQTRPSGLTSDRLPSGLAMVPFTLIEEGKKHHMQLLGGFTGVIQDAETLEIKPRLGWAVRKAPPIDCAFIDLPEDCKVRPPLCVEDYDIYVDKLLDTGSWSRELISGDILRFYRETNGFRYHDLRVYGLKEVFYFPIAEDSEFGIKWLRIGEYDDGTHLALETNFDSQGVYHVSRHGAYLLAPSFSDFMQHLKAGKR